MPEPETRERIARTITAHHGEQQIVGSRGWRDFGYRDVAEFVEMNWRDALPEADAVLAALPAPPKGEWRDIASAPKGRVSILLLLGESIPEVPDVRVGSYTDGAGCAELGYPEYAERGGWLVWNAESDFFIIDVADALRWRPTDYPSPPLTEPEGRRDD